MDECRVRAVKAFHSETNVKLLLRRVYGSLQVQTDVVQNEAILELVISHERGAVFMMRGAKIIEITALDVSVQVKPQIPERFTETSLVQEVH